MKNLFRFGILSLVLLSCSKEELIDTVNSEEGIYSLNNPYEVKNTPDYSKTSYETRIPFPEQITRYRIFSNWHAPLEAVVLDYDKDGYLDIVETQSEYGTYTRNKIKFMKGTSSGELIEDTLNSNIHDGLIHGRKGLTGDYNNDGWPDIFFIGHGYDIFDGTYPNEEYPILLLNKQGTGFEYIPFTSISGFFHTGTSGDIDNDGDLDILLIDGGKGTRNSFVLYNNGDATFTSKVWTEDPKFSIPLFSQILGKFTSELIDINKDGYLDLLLAGHEYQQYDTPPTVFLNSEQGFTESIVFPQNSIYSIVNDVDFYDLNKDGYDEIITTRTKGNPFYSSFQITVHNITGKDITSEYFENNINTGFVNSDWLPWISIVNENDKVYLRGDDMETPNKWEFINGKFYKN